MRGAKTHPCECLRVPCWSCFELHRQFSRVLDSIVANRSFFPAHRKTPVCVQKITCQRSTHRACPTKPHTRRTARGVWRRAVRAWCVRVVSPRHAARATLSSPSRRVRESRRERPRGTGRTTSGLIFKGRQSKLGRLRLVKRKAWLLTQAHMNRVRCVFSHL